MLQFLGKKNYDYFKRIQWISTNLLLNVQNIPGKWNQIEESGGEIEADSADDRNYDWFSQRFRCLWVNFIHPTRKHFEMSFCCFFFHESRFRELRWHFAEVHKINTRNRYLRWKLEFFRLLVNAHFWMILFKSPSAWWEIQVLTMKFCMKSKIGIFYVPKNDEKSGNIAFLVSKNRYVNQSTPNKFPWVVPIGRLPSRTYQLFWQQIVRTQLLLDWKSFRRYQGSGKVYFFFMWSVISLT